jgi:actin-related protein 5
VVFDNVVSKYRDRHLNETVLAVGMDALADPTAKSSTRSPFENNVVCDFERMVNQPISKPEINPR